MNIIPDKYHPRNATGVERVGAFYVHRYPDGAELVTYRKARDSLLQPTMDTRTTC